MKLMAENRSRVPELYLFDRMTFVARTFDRKSRLAVMAGPARGTLLHLRHCMTLLVLARREYAVVALAALVQPGMKLMTEHRRPGLFHFEPDLFGGFVAAAAISLYRKRQVTVVTGTARAILLHFGHKVSPVIMVRGKEGIMAITAAVHLDMPQVRKSGISCKLDLLYRMAFAAIPGYRESSFTVMTCSAGFSLLHLSH